MSDNGKVSEILLSALDESLKDIFGKTAAKAVYYHLRTQYLIGLEDIPKKPRLFAKAIREIFGGAGAEVIETLIVKDLCAKFRSSAQMLDICTLEDCMDKLKLRSVKENNSS
ncbi:MAG: DUF3227 domain-containing protein [Candidatus Bathyarchaeota archaeon]|nr:MAG: DUF3227 domain-containing protein [Candidatus Bathyarchaeota archaeon]